MVTINQLKQLREQTGISLIECKKALEEAKGDIERAKEILREKGKESVKGKEGRTSFEGVVSSYIHARDKIGVLLEIHCQSDFVAKSDDFKKLAHEICLQIAAARPLFVKKEEIPEEFLDIERRIYQKQFEGSGKPEKIIEQIIEGKLVKYKKEISLLSQPWIRDETKTIEDLIGDYVAKLGEKIEVGRFARYEI
ncbi:MAG: translation elongation factor Ts [Patescibacteria group bacterium]|nr:translation elongation factor Ts [Patescibacteria group bacterium]